MELCVNTSTNGFPVSSVLCVVLELREFSEKVGKYLGKFKLYHFKQLFRWDDS